MPRNIYVPRGPRPAQERKRRYTAVPTGYITIGDAAARLHCSEAKIYKIVYEGKVEALKEDGARGRMLLSIASLDRHILASETVPPGYIPMIEIKRRFRLDIPKIRNFIYKNKGFEGKMRVGKQLYIDPVKFEACYFGREVIPNPDDPKAGGTSRRKPVSAMAPREVSTMGEMSAKAFQMFAVQTEGGRPIDLVDIVIKLVQPPDVIKRLWEDYLSLRQGLYFENHQVVVLQHLLGLDLDTIDADLVIRAVHGLKDIVTFYEKDKEKKSKFVQVDIDKSKLRPVMGPPPPKPAEPEDETDDEPGGEPLVIPTEGGAPTTFEIAPGSRDEEPDFEEGVPLSRTDLAALAEMESE